MNFENQLLVTMDKHFDQTIDHSICFERIKKGIGNIIEEITLQASNNAKKMPSIHKCLFP